jgi:LytS/YehU family sensor histidine kinase
MLFKHKVIFWISLSLMLLGLFLWLAGIAMPEIATPFAIGTTFVLVSGLFTGHVLTKLAIRNHAIGSVVNAIVLSALFMLIGFVAIAFLLNSMIRNTTLFPFAITVLLVFLETAAAGCLVTMIRNQYTERITSAHAAMAQSKSELQLLQSQLSPHFLFNTLNNLYGLSMMEPAKLPPLLLKLSDLLRYSVYEVKELFVPLQHEVDYIRNYVDFERLRLGDRLQLSLGIDPVPDTRCRIPPLMLIVFVENAFKHSRATGQDLISLNISMVKTGNQLEFVVSNSVVSEGSVHQTDGNSGFGLESVRKRLKLLYPDRHKLKIEKTESRHSVYLQLECQ